MQKGENPLPVVALAATCSCRNASSPARSHKMLRVVKTLVLGLHLLSLVQLLGACGPGRGGARRQVIKHRPPLVQRQHLPSSDEHTVGASGPPEGPIRRKDVRFRELVQNWNPDIEFADQERTGADRMMSQRLKEKLSTLAISVMNRWPNVRLRVIEGWDEDNQHGPKSLHYEGRAVDITTSDRDRTKYGMLARLAVEAGFDWVHYEARTHIHCSVKSEKADIIRNNGCFDGSSLLSTPTGLLEMSQLQLNDPVLVMNSRTGKLHFSPVIMWLDYDRHGQELYVELTTRSGRLIRLTSSHLLYATEEPPNLNKESPSTSAADSHMLPVEQAPPSAGSGNKTNVGNYYYSLDTSEPSNDANMSASLVESSHIVREATNSTQTAPSSPDNVPNTNRRDMAEASVADSQFTQPEIKLEDFVFKTYARNLVVGQYLLVDPSNPSETTPGLTPTISEITSLNEPPVGTLLPYADDSSSLGKSYGGRLSIGKVEDVSERWTSPGTSVEFDEIVGVEYSVRRGIYAPLTREGNIVVNSVVASCYAVIKDHELAHLSLAPVRWLSYMRELMFGLRPDSPTEGRTVAGMDVERQAPEEQEYYQHETSPHNQPKHGMNVPEEGARRLHWYPTMLYKLGRLVLPTSYLY